MRSKRYRNQLPIIFNPVDEPPEIEEKDIIDIAFDEFMPAVIKLKKEGLHSLCQEWWRSRFSDHLTSNNSAPGSQAEYCRRKTRFDAWPAIWKKYNEIMIAWEKRS